MATIVWSIQWMNVKPVEGDNQDVVVTAGWSCAGTETANDQEYNTSIYATCTFPAPEGSFTPYNQLTQDQVLGWCWENGVDKDVTEAAVQSQLDNLINPPIVQPPLPWATPQ